MEKFLKSVKTDPKLKKEFFDYMHKAEKKSAKGMETVAKQMNAQVMKMITDFCKSKKIAIKDSPKVQKQMAMVCKKIQEQLNAMVVKQFHALLANYGKSAK